MTSKIYILILYMKDEERKKGREKMKDYTLNELQSLSKKDLVSLLMEEYTGGDDDEIGAILTTSDGYIVRLWTSVIPALHEYLDRHFPGAFEGEGEEEVAEVAEIYGLNEEKIDRRAFETMEEETIREAFRYAEVEKESAGGYMN